MTIRIQAVFEHGVLRPLEPLTIPEGDTVDVTITRSDTAGVILETTDSRGRGLREAAQGGRDPGRDVRGHGHGL